MKVNQLKAGIILSYIQIAVTAAVSLVYTPVMLRLLGDSEFGLFNIATSITSYLGLLNLGFSSSYVRYYSRYKVAGDDEGLKKLNGVYIVTYSIFSLVALICGIILSFNIRLIFDKGLTDSELATARVLMLILTANLSVTMVTSIFTSYISANEKFVFQKLLIIVKTVTGPLVSLPVMFLSGGSIGLVLATTVVSISAEIANIVFCCAKLKMKFALRGADFKLLREIFIFSSFIAINSLVDQINWNIDKILLGRFRGTGEVTIYGLASQLNSMYITVSTAVSSVFVPRVHTLVNIEKDNAKINGLFLRVSRIQMLILGLVMTGFVVFGREFLYLWGGAGKEDAYYIDLLLLGSATVPLTQNLGIEIQRAMNMHKFRSFVYLAMAGVNIVLSIYLCRLYGGIGCASGTAIAFVFANILAMNIYYQKKNNIDIVAYWKNILRILPSQLLPMLCGFLFWNLLGGHGALALLCGIAAYCVFYAASVWFFGMNNYEKSLVYSFVRKIKGKR